MLQGAAGVVAAAAGAARRTYGFMPTCSYCGVISCLTVTRMISADWQSCLCAGGSTTGSGVVKLGRFHGLEADRLAPGSSRRLTAVVIELAAGRNAAYMTRSRWIEAFALHMCLLLQRQDLQND